MKFILEVKLVRNDGTVILMQQGVLEIYPDSSEVGLRWWRANDPGEDIIDESRSYALEGFVASIRPTVRKLR